MNSGLDNTPAPEIKSDFLKKLDNIWFHYKWHIIIIGFFTVFILISLVQCVSKVTPDAELLYAGPASLKRDDLITLQSDFTRILDEDLNGDGKVKVDYSEYTILNEEQVKAAQANGDMMDINYQITIRKQLDNEVMTGDCVIYLLDPSQYESLASSGAFMPLSQAIGYEPSIQLDKYSIPIKELAAYDYFAGISSLPANTVIAVRNYPTLKLGESESSEKERYDNNFKLLKKLLEFKMPENVE
ncbi:MAG: hypothetical protein AB9835_03845 [Eubacteriales bacterium]